MKTRKTNPPPFTKTLITLPYLSNVLLHVYVKINFAYKPQKILFLQQQQQQKRNEFLLKTDHKTKNLFSAYSVGMYVRSFVCLYVWPVKWMVEWMEWNGWLNGMVAWSNVYRKRKINTNITNNDYKWTSSGMWQVVTGNG